MSDLLIKDLKVHMLKNGIFCFETIYCTNQETFFLVMGYSSFEFFICRAVANINMDTCVAGPILVPKASPVLKVSCLRIMFYLYFFT